VERVSQCIRETVKDQVARFDREFQPLTRWSETPMTDAIKGTKIGEESATKEQLAEWSGSGTRSKFWFLAEKRETLYHRSKFERDSVYFHPSESTAFWLALNDLCLDTSEVGRFARRYRAIRVRDVLRSERGE
jgi:hypothetical protein